MSPAERHYARLGFSSRTDEWPTSQKTFDELDREFDFTLDPCSTHDNAKCARHFTKEDDGLAQSWAGETVFCNPPYGREIRHWIRKAYTSAQEGATVVALIPARTDTRYWHQYIQDRADEIRFVPGRLRFGDGRYPAPSRR